MNVRTWTQQLQELEEKYSECIEMLHEAQEELKNLRNRSFPAGTPRRYHPLGLYPMVRRRMRLDGRQSADAIRIFPKESPSFRILWQRRSKERWGRSWVWMIQSVRSRSTYGLVHFALFLSSVRASVNRARLSRLQDPPEESVWDGEEREPDGPSALADSDQLQHPRFQPVAVHSDVPPVQRPLHASIRHVWQRRRRGQCCLWQPDADHPHGDGLQSGQVSRSLCDWGSSG